MVTNVRTFLREFAAFKARARKGETVRVQDRGGVFVFRADVPRKSLLGAARGRITIRGDITRPTLKADAWKPSV